MFFNYFSPRKICLIKIFCLAIAYFLTGKLGILLAVPPGYATAIYPPSGIALAGMLLLGYRSWWGILLGSFALNSSIVSSPDNTQILIAFIIACGATLQAVAGTYLLKHFANFPNPLASEKNVFQFIFYGGVLSALVNSTLSVSSLAMLGRVPLTHFVTNWTTWWIGDAIGIFVFTPLVLVWFFREHDYFNNRRIIVTAISLTTFLLITITFSYEKRQELEHLKLKFNQHAFGFNVELERTLEQNLSVLTSLQIFYASSNDVNRSEFQIATTSFLKKLKGIRAIGWSPVVLDKHRKQFELSIQKEGFADFEITQLDDDKKRIRATTQEKYTPVTYIEPISSNQSAMGYNLYSDKLRADVLDYARDSGEVSLTPKITLVQSQHKELGAFIAYMPVYRNGVPHETLEERQQHIEGYISAVFEIDELVKSALSSQSLNDENHKLVETEKVHFYLVDETTLSEPHNLFTSENTKHLIEPNLFSSSHTMTVGNQKWRLMIKPTDDYFVSHHVDNALLMLMSSLFLTSMAGAAVMVSSGREHLLQELVEKKTHELTKSEQRLTEMISLMPISVFIKDSDSRIILMNTACEAQWGIVFSDVANTRGEHFFPEKQMTLFLETDKRIFDEGKLIELDEVVWNAQLQSNRILHTYKKPVFDTSGNADYLIGISVDITDAKKHEQMILDAKLNAESLAKSKSEFLANMSHEIRTPMNAIIGLSQLALNKEVSDEIRDYLEKINTSSFSLLGILNDILDFSKMEAGKLVIEKNYFNLVVMMRNFHNLFAATAESKNITFNIDSDFDIPTHLMGDSMRIQQVISNLLGNAFKFTKQGEVTLKLELLDIENMQVKIRFSVIDTGIGIAKSDQKNLFKPFHQVDTSITRRFGGTGLGLAISHTLLQLMESDFKIQSELGKGTTFSFDLLLDIATTEQRQNTISQQNASKAGMLSSKLREQAQLLIGSSILVAEDNLINQEVVCEFLKLSGMHVDVANDGIEVLRLLRKNNYDAILMDVHMPEMSGLEATCEIRKNPLYQNLPIIALTAGVTVDEQLKCLEIGMNDFATKPVNPEELIRVLSHWISVQKSNSTNCA